MHITGWPTWFFVVPFFIGAFVCGISGVAAGIFAFTCVSDWIIERLVQRYYVYGVFFDMVIADAIKRRNKRAEKTD